MRKQIDKGAFYGHWRVLRPSKKVDYFECLCSCGTRREVNRYSLTSGKSRSCGCAKIAQAAKTREERNG